jgi:diaminohydroxyphosphoribosylaminopyrimidine deaminase/5-amino-6-(5-phosphoribosylamino)uracil reductase
MAGGFSEHDSALMNRALRIAARGRGAVEPNPMVGCVIARDGRVVGEGYHRKFGDDHAEVEAIRAAGSDVSGATVYVTLEPCSHFGKTPPCADTLIRAGVKRVMAAMGDPGPHVHGKGFRKLRRAGIGVACGLMEQEARRLNGAYLKRVACGRPWVILKWAQSLDGKIATRTGDSQWISSEKSRRRVHRIRGCVDAIIVGVGTVVADDPELTCRFGRRRRIATRVVLDPKLRTPMTARVVATGADVPTILVAGVQAARSPKAKKIESNSVEVLGIPSRRSGLDLGRLLDKLGRRGMSNVLVEGGAKTVSAFIESGLADEALVFVSRRIIGGEDAPSAVGGRGPAHVAKALVPVASKLVRSGDDDLYELRFTEP